MKPGTRKTAQNIFRIVVLFVAFAFSSVFPGIASAATTSNLGNEFWLTFPDQYWENTNPHQFQLFISSATNVTGVVSIQAAGFSSAFTVPAGGMTVVGLPDSAGVTTLDGVTTQGGVHVTASGNVAVYGFAYEQYSTDAFLALPVDTLGLNYMVTAFQTESFSANTTLGGEFCVVATRNGTTLTIQPSVTTANRAAGVPYMVSLNQGDVYQLIDPTVDNDLTGTVISSNLPVALLGGSQIADVPNRSYTTANYLVEQAWPVADWGTHFITEPLATRTGGDLFRILAYSSGTQVFLNGSLAATLNAGQYFQQEVVNASEITTNYPVNVAQYSNSRTWDNVTYSDPFMVTVPPVAAYDSTYIVGAPLSNFPVNYINLVVPTSATGSILLDGSLVSSASFTQVGASAYSGAQVSVGTGSHTLSGSAPFGVISYGFATKDGYGYPGAGQLVESPPSFTPTATPTLTPTLTPTVTDTPTITPTATPPFHIWPNPYDPSVAVRGTLKAGYLPDGVLTIFTVSGESVAKLTPVNGWFEWNGKTDKGRDAATGIYYYVARKNEEDVEKGVLLIKSGGH